MTTATVEQLGEQLDALITAARAASSAQGSDPSRLRTADEPWNELNASSLDENARATVQAATNWRRALTVAVETNAEEKRG